jgi:TetR/AcrR family transcriptional regulator
VRPLRATPRELILVAAEKVFARAGFGGAAMEALAAAAGLPKANVHYHFGSWEAAARAMQSE